MILVEPPTNLVVPNAPSVAWTEPREHGAGNRRPQSSSQTSNETIVEIQDVEVFDAYYALGVLPPRKMFVRGSVNQMLSIAERLLPLGLGLCVLDALRTSEEQSLLIAHYGAGQVERGFVAALSEDGVRAPHLTGGAVDLTIKVDAGPLALGTDFDSFTPESSMHYTGKLSQTARQLRSWLAFSMLSVGFAPHPDEWWHWSFGDDNWARYFGWDYAIYDEV